MEQLLKARRIRMLSIQPDRLMLHVVLITLEKITYHRHTKASVSCTHSWKQQCCTLYSLWLSRYWCHPCCCLLRQVGRWRRTESSHLPLSAIPKTRTGPAFCVFPHTEETPQNWGWKRQQYSTQTTGNPQESQWEKKGCEARRSRLAAKPQRPGRRRGFPTLAAVGCIPARKHRSSFLFCFSLSVFRLPTCSFRHKGVSLLKRMPRSTPASSRWLPSQATLFIQELVIFNI